MIYLKTICFIASAELLIYIGITFLSGQLLPTTLANIHEHMPQPVKLLIFAFVISVPANMLISWGFRFTGPSFAAVVYAACVVAGAMISAILIDGARLTPGAVVAFSTMLLASIWGIVELRATIAP